MCVAAAPAREALSPDPVIVDFFYEAGCTECKTVRTEVFPVLEARLAGLYVLRRYDTGIASNVARLVAYQRALDMKANEPVSVVIDYRHVLDGLDAISGELVPLVEQATLARYEPDWSPPKPISVPGAAEHKRFVAEHVRDFALWTVIGAGLLDGVNPCAISTLVFFVSLLAVAKVGGRGLLAVGASFCVASFLTYTALGFGLLHVLHTFSGFPILQAGIDLTMMAVLAALAWLSFRDARRYGTTGRPGDVTLQLPKRVKERIHSIMRTRLKTHNLVIGGLLIGCAVTALAAWTYLLLYNTMFITPLVCVFLLTFYGMKTKALIEWSEHNVVSSKVLLGILFAAMAVLIGVL
jgi:hypothetical protein